MTDLTTTATQMGRQAAAKVREFTNTNPMAKQAKDALYTAVGAGVMGAQKAAKFAKETRVEFDTDAVGAGIKRSVDEATGTLKRQAAWVDEHLEVAFKRVDDALAPIEDKLPASVRETRIKVREMATKVLHLVPSERPEDQN